MTLYEINQTIADIIENGFSVDEETGEILFDESDMQSLQASISEKLENVACYIKNEDATAKALAEEIKSLQERKKLHEKKIEHLKGYLKYAMELTDTKKFESARCKLSWRKSEKAIVDDLNAIPKDFIKEVTEVKPMLTEIKKAIKNGEEVAGVHIEEMQNLQIK